MKESGQDMTINMQDERLHKIWDERWKGSAKKDPLGFVGRIIFKAKEGVFKDILNELQGGRVIEVGCGIGSMTRILDGAGLDYIGIDASPAAVRICKENGLRAEAKRLEEVLEEYDLVFSDGMLEHFINFEPYARHLMRISRRYVLLIQPNHDSFCGKTLVYLAELLRRDKNVFEYNYRIRDFISSFEENGFSLRKNMPVFFDVYRMLLFEREKRSK